MLDRTDRFNTYVETLDDELRRIHMLKGNQVCYGSQTFRNCTNKVILQAQPCQPSKAVELQPHRNFFFYLTVKIMDNCRKTAKGVIIATYRQRINTVMRQVELA